MNFTPVSVDMKESLSLLERQKLWEDWFQLCLQPNRPRQLLSAIEPLSYSSSSKRTGMLWETVSKALRLPGSHGFSLPTCKLFEEMR